jgi:aryl-alcohol dehydrogenase-like predicted oxidoreductase
MQALNDLVKAGKVREIGCSNFSVEQMRGARATPGPIFRERAESLQHVQTRS